jgi:hypothetical protein
MEENPAFTGISRHTLCLTLLSCLWGSLFLLNIFVHVEMEGVRPRVLFAVTGSVAAIKVYEIVRGLTTLQCDVRFYQRSDSKVRVMATKAACHFFSSTPTNSGFDSMYSFTLFLRSLAEIPGYRGLIEGAAFYTDEDEYQVWTGRGDPVLHIRLRDWADYLLVAPLSANTLAKMANGLCDNLVVGPNFPLTPRHVYSGRGIFPKNLFY